MYMYVPMCMHICMHVDVMYGYNCIYLYVYCQTEIPNTHLKHTPMLNIN